MLLSDRDIIAAQTQGGISLTPWTPEMVQPASVDVRLDRFFRLFNNHEYTYVDPSEDQGNLTEQIEVAPDEPWVPPGNTSSLMAQSQHGSRGKAHSDVLAFSLIPRQGSSIQVLKGTSPLSCRMSAIYLSNCGRV
jgi:hypothetical protein